VAWILKRGMFIGYERLQVNVDGMCVDGGRCLRR
jgi:hypothetical protein